MTFSSLRRLLLIVLCFSFMAGPLYAATSHINQLVPQTWKMLDYMSADYSGAIADDGSVINKAEYAEMREFSETALNNLQQLPEKSGKSRMVDQARAFVELIKHKAPHAKVAKQAHKINKILISMYPIPTAPDSIPDITKAKTLYQNHCAACHGADGQGNGPAAAQLDPAPVDFTNSARADQRSPLSYYQTITQGVAGTSMTSFDKTLGESDRWALAYYVGQFAYQNDIKAGKTLWQDGTLARAQVSNLEELSSTRANQIASALGKEKAHALVGYLRANPAALETALTGIPLARGRLKASVAAYQEGDKKAATQLALSAYLDGVEPVEPQLDVHNRNLRSQIELDMGAFRTSLNKGASPDAIARQARKIDRLLLEAQTLTANTAQNAATTFLGAFTILLREGLEALLVVIAIIAFIKKAERPEVLPYIHSAWILALVAGGFTWAIAHYFIEISGASRELTEGISSLFAVLMLLGVGLWMHQKSIGNRWQAYIKQKMNQAMNKKSVWLLFILTFITVYREMFETILFYIALWTKGQGYWFMAGIACAIILLALIAWVMLKTSRKLPLARFFQASAILIAVLCVVLTGKGVSALQEAGWMNVSIAPIPHVDLLGIYPTWQTAIAQLAIVILLLVGIAYNKRAAAKQITAT